MRRKPEKEDEEEARCPRDRRARSPFQSSVRLVLNTYSTPSCTARLEDPRDKSGRNEPVEGFSWQIVLNHILLRRLGKILQDSTSRGGGFDPRIGSVKWLGGTLGKILQDSTSRGGGFDPRIGSVKWLGGVL